MVTDTGLPVCINIRFCRNGIPKQSYATPTSTKQNRTEPNRIEHTHNEFTDRYNTIFVLRLWVSSHYQNERNALAKYKFIRNYNAQPNAN